MSEEHHDAAAAPQPQPSDVPLPPQAQTRATRETALAQRKHATWQRRHIVLAMRRRARLRISNQARLMRRTAWGAVLLALFCLVGSVLASASVAAAYYQSQAAAIQGLHHQISSANSLRIYDRNGTLLYELDQNGAQHSIPLAQMPVSVINATIAIEDHTFWTNAGVDPAAIFRAAVANASHGRIVEGASTITQQLLKTQLLGNQETYTRKLQEAILALGITQSGAYSKAQVVEMYLNSAPYSPTAYGIDAAAYAYFGYRDDPTTGMSAAQHLDLAQAAMLAGIPQNPNYNDPMLYPQKALQRQHDVLAAMVRYGYITQAQADQAAREAERKGFLTPPAQAPNLAPQFVNYVQQQLVSLVGAGQLHNLARSGLRVYTTLDLRMQQATINAMQQHLFGNDRTDFYYPTYIRNDNVSNSAALIASHHTGSIRVYVGGVSASTSQPSSQFDVVSSGYRSPGSSFKPLVYAAAFEQGWFPALTVGDVPTAFWDAGMGKAYKPLDYDATAATGAVTLRTALDWSLNIPAVKVMQFAGIQNVRSLVQRMGITSWRGQWGLSSVLGSLDVTPFEMVQAYSVFANYGQFVPLHAISRVEDSSGSVLYQYSQPTPVQVLDPRVAFLITSILSDNASRAGDFGGCSPLYLAPYAGPGKARFTFSNAYSSAQCGYLNAHRYLSPDAWPTAAKTGTAQNFKNDWTLGYTMDYTGAVWVGNNNDTPMYNIDGLSGSAPIWYAGMLSAEQLQNKARRPFPVPQGVHLARYCSQSVCTTDWFLDGATPPPNLGESNTQVLCVTLDSNGGGWHAAKSGCQVHLLLGKTMQNAGAPPGQVTAVGAP